MLAQKGYNYGKHYAPHDIKARELGTGKSRLEVAQSMGIRFEIAPSIPRIDGIGAVRGLLSRVWIDKEKGKHLINCLKQYRKDWDEKGQRFRDHPLHDWSSNGADSFRYLCVSYKEKLIKTQSHFVLKSGFKL
jgi:hypothetical protein